MLPEYRFPRSSDPSDSGPVQRRSSLGSHLERSSVAYYFANPDATPFYPSCHSIIQSSTLHPHSIHPISLLPPADLAEPYISMLEISEEPATRDPGALAGTLHAGDPPLLGAPEELHSSEG